MKKLLIYNVLPLFFVSLMASSFDANAQRWSEYPRTNFVNPGDLFAISIPGVTNKAIAGSNIVAAIGAQPAGLVQPPSGNLTNWSLIATGSVVYATDTKLLNLSNANSSISASNLTAAYFSGAGGPAPFLLTNATTLVATAALDAGARASRMNLTFTTTTNVQSARSNYFTINLVGVPPNTNNLYVWLGIYGTNDQGNFTWTSTSNTITIATATAPATNASFGVSIFSER